MGIGSDTGRYGTMRKVVERWGKGRAVHYRRAGLTLVVGVALPLLVVLAFAVIGVLLSEIGVE